MSLKLELNAGQFVVFEVLLTELIEGGGNRETTENDDGNVTKNSFGYFAKKTRITNLM